MRPDAPDTMKRREEFAISLRKRKKEEFIRHKRMKLLGISAANNTASGKDESSTKVDSLQSMLSIAQDKLYTGCPLIEEDCGRHQHEILKPHIASMESLVAKLYP